MTDDAGHVGWGEAPALKDWGGEFGRYFGESAATVAARHRALSRARGDRRPGSAISACCTSAWTPSIKGYPYAKAAIDFAAYDLAGRALRHCRCTCCSAAPCAIPIPITHSIGLMEIDAGEREAAQVAAEGIRTIKIKVGVEPARDVEMVRRDPRGRGPGRRALRRCERGLPDAGRGDQDHAQDGGVRPHLCRAAGAWASSAWPKSRARSTRR